MEKQHVFAGIDNSNLAKSVTHYASWIASTVNVPLSLLHNIEHVETPATSDLSGSIGFGSREHLLQELIELEAKRSKLMVEQGKSILDDASKLAVQDGVVDCRTLQRHGSLSETLVELEEDIRVLVLGARGEDHADSSSGLGNQIESIIRSLHKPVLIVNHDFTTPKSLLLAYDGSIASEKALDWLCTSPLYKSMTCHLVHVCSDPFKGNELLKGTQKKLENAGIVAKSQILQGNTQEQLLQYQQEKNIDLIVMGSFGHSRLREMFLGSFTLKMIKSASIPLLLLR